MINKKEIVKELKRLNESKMIKIQNTDKERRVFINSNDVFEIWGSEDKEVLCPFDDYTYEWLNSFLYAVIDLIDRNNYDDLEELEEDIRDNISEWVDSEIDVYTSDLTEWLNHSNGNVYYLDEVAKEGHIENILMIAQGKAIDELFHNALNELMIYLNDNYGED